MTQPAEFPRTRQHLRKRCKSHYWMRIAMPLWARSDGWQQCQLCGKVMIA